MKIKNAIEILNIQKNKLNNIDRPLAQLWAIQTHYFIKDFFGENSQESHFITEFSKKIKTESSEFDYHIKSAGQFISYCIETIHLKGVYRPMMNLHSLARIGILISKILVLVFILFIIISVAKKYIPRDYNIYVIGIVCSIFLISGFMMVRMSTFKPRTTYDDSNLRNHNEQLSLLLINITYDIDKFEEASSYYFNGVRVYKYSTMVLAGVSTILLGLNFSQFSADFNEKYSEVAKNIAFVIGAIITVYTGLMTYWNIEKYWLQNKTVVNKLRSLRDEIENDDKAKYLNFENIGEKFKKYQVIKDDFYKYWEGALSGRDAQNSTS